MAVSFDADHTMAAGVWQVTEIEKKGLGVRAKAPIKRAEVICWEFATVSMQTIESRRDVAVCAHCLGFAGSLDTQLDLLLREKWTVQLTADAKESASKRKLPTLGAAFPSLHLAQVVRCAHKCGELYCSEQCRDRA